MLQIVQQSFLELFASLENFDPHTNGFKAFLKRLVVKNGLKGKSIVYIPTVLPGLREWNHFDGAATAAALKALPAGVHMIILMVAMEGFTLPEVATQMAVKEPQRLHELSQLVQVVRDHQPLIREKIKQIPVTLPDPEEGWETMAATLEKKSGAAPAVAKPVAGESAAGEPLAGGPVAEELLAEETIVEEPVVEESSSERTWTGWAFLLFLIAASLLMLYWSGIFSGNLIPAPKPPSNYKPLKK